jgi:aspartyl-tRNA(Asn)/glutamyl-tRNA(Gln) amidotransferase subunit C
MAGERDVFEIARVAALARLRLTPDEVSRYRTQLTAILDYMRQIEAVETTGVPGAALDLLPAGVSRPDEVRPSLAPDAALANAPDTIASPRLVRVPRVLG